MPVRSYRAAFAVTGQFIDRLMRRSWVLLLAMATAFGVGSGAVQYLSRPKLQERIADAIEAIDLIRETCVLAAPRLPEPERSRRIEEINLRCSEATQALLQSVSRYSAAASDTLSGPRSQHSTRMAELDAGLDDQIGWALAPFAEVLAPRTAPLLLAAGWLQVEVTELTISRDADLHHVIIDIAGTMVNTVNHEQVNQLYLFLGGSMVQPICSAASTNQGPTPWRFSGSIPVSLVTTGVEFPLALVATSAPSLALGAAHAEVENGGWRLTLATLRAYRPD